MSVGRGTATPFELLGAPWIDADQLTQYLTGRQIPGVEFTRAHFVPEGDRFKNRECRGVRILLTDRQVLDSPSLGIEIASALYRLYQKEFEIEKMLPLIGAPWLLDALKEKDPHFIVSQWQESLETFRGLRVRYLLY